MLKMIELLIVKINVKIFANSMIENFLISLAIELLAIKVNAKIFANSMNENFVINLANRSRLILTLIVKNFTTIDDELNSCKRSNK